MAVIGALKREGWSYDEITAVYEEDTYLVGKKYRAKAEEHRELYLKMTYEKVTDVPIELVKAVGKKDKKAGYALSDDAFVKELVLREKMIHVRGAFYRYTDVGCWTMLPVKAFQQLVISLLGEYHMPIKASKFKEITCLAGVMLNKDIIFNSNRNFLNMRNGMLNLKDLTLHDHDPSYYSTIQLPYCFDPSVECPRFLQFLDEILPDQNVQKVIQEVLGSCLSSDTSYERCIFLYGGGGNGKNTLLEVLTGMVAHENVSNVTYADFRDRFRLANLENKLRNCSGVILSREN